jgi:hypothetical protein
MPRPDSKLSASTGAVSSVAAAAPAPARRARPTAAAPVSLPARFVVKFIYLYSSVAGLSAAFKPNDDELALSDASPRPDARRSQET